jgi:RNA polymerase sigma-70 factor (ECF subfamily)
MKPTQPHGQLAGSAAFPEDAPDILLVAHAVSGDTFAFERIMRRYNRLLFRTARSIMKNDGETEDVLQEAYLRAWGALSGFRADAKLSTWLVRIVVNEALGRKRKQSARIIALDTAMISPELQPDERMEDDPDGRPERMAMRAEMRRLMESHIDALPDAYRTVFMLRAVEELDVDEVAAVLQLPAATVRSRFFRARGLLRESLARNVDVATGDAFSFAGERCDRIVAAVLARLPGLGPLPAILAGASHSIQQEE